MKTIRTIIATLSAVLLTFALVAWFSVRRSAAFIQRTIYQGFDQTFVVALVMGCAFLLIAIILSVAIASTDDEEDEEEEESFQPRHQTRPVAVRSEEPYRRVSRSVEQGRLAEQSRSRREAEDEFARPRPRTEPKPQRRKGEEPPAQRKRERVADRPDQVAVSRREPPVKKEKKAPRPQEEPEQTWEAEEEELPVTPEAEAARDADETPEAPAKGADREDTVRCIFCGSEMSRSAEYCPHCGKKR